MKCKAYPQCSGKCIWNPNTKQCEEVPLSSTGAPPEVDYSGMFCVKGEVVSDEIDIPEGVEVQKCIVLDPQCSSDGSCVTQYLCPIDLVQCQIQSDQNCPPGSQLDGNVCSTSASCPSGSTYNPITGKCEAPCTVSKTCNLTATTNEGAANVFQKYTSRIGLLGIYTCGCPNCPPPNTCSCSFSSSGNGRKVFQIYTGFIGMQGVSTCSCDPGTTTCEVSYASCPSGFTYNPSTGKCEMPPTVVQKDVCPYGSNRTCVVYNGQKVCSPYDCGKMEDTDTPDEPPSGLEEDQNYEQGVCQGTIYIFNGKKMRCRPSGLQTGFHNCCDEAKGRLYDSTGSTGMALGDAIKAIYVAMEIIKQARLISQVAKAQVFKDSAGNVVAVVLFGKNDNYITTFFEKEAEVWAKSILADGVSVPATSGLPGREIVDKNALFTNYTENYFQTFAPQLAAQLVVFALTKAIDDPVLSAAVNLVAQALLVKLGLASPVGVFFAALELALALFTPRCDAQDILTSTYKESGYCHYVGSRCIKKILGKCVQKSKVYCCFNSKLARIIHEQGRPQLTTFGPDGGWGSAKRPNCRGFTPEEFQAIDFGRIDFSEYIEDIQRNIRRNIEPQIQQIFEETIKTTYPGQPY
ncbi:MAG: conjugal transfer protein TraN [Candidatus Methanomethylicia archaeon]